MTPIDASQRVSKIQQALRQRQLPAWLFYGFHQLDPTAYRILGFPEDPHVTRRWFYLVPREGKALKLVHRIEAGQLDHLPGDKRVYLHRRELQAGLKALLEGVGSVAMQYSENNNIPYLSKVDAGTIEWIRSLGVEVVSSGDLVQLFEAVWSGQQLSQHRETAKALNEIVHQAFEQVAARLKAGQGVDEFQVQKFILDGFAEKGLVTDHPPIVGVNRNSGNPHYSPSPESSQSIEANSLLLIDLWAKPAKPGAVYADITWTAYYGDQPPVRVKEVFEIVKRARDRGVEILAGRIEGGAGIEGWEVDDAVRGVIEEAGYGEFFVHRTGHNLNQDVHGNGVNFDNLETHDTREVIPGIACTIEPGIYLPEFGIRSEINVYIGEKSVEVTTPAQEDLLHFRI